MDSPPKDHPHPRFRVSGRVLAIAGLLWVALLFAGFGFLWKLEFTPAEQKEVAARFPEKTAVPLAKQGMTLVMFAHPGCPCTRASFSELGKILAGAGKPVSPVIVFMSAGEAGSGKGELWRRALEFPGALLMRDASGDEARTFGVTASGHALLYQPDGTLLFSGGITLSRGHEGDNPGESAISSFLGVGAAPLSKTPVFGCELLNE